VIKYPPNTLISIHNHPESKPPSGSDFYSCGIRKYKKGIICCHNGDVYVYQTGKKPLLKHEYAELRYMEKGYSQNEAHILASKKYNYAKYCE
jgi:hypothetical protein